MSRSVHPLLSETIMKPYLLSAAALFLATTCASAQNSNLPQVQNSYMSGSSSRSAFEQQQRQMQMMQMRQMQQQRQGAGSGRANLGQTYGNQVPQAQAMPQQMAPQGAPQQQMAAPQMYSNGLPQVRTSRYCGMPGEDMLRNNVRSAAVQARQPRKVVQPQPKPAAPQGPAYSYEGGYEYKGK